MKKDYEKPVSLIEEFQSTDVITTSSGNDVQGDDNTVEWPF